MIRTLFPTMLLGIALLAAGCASAPPSEAPAAVSDCVRLEIEMLRAEDARRAGLEKEQNAWKAIVPFAVAARYASGQSMVARADRQIETFRSRLARQGCVALAADGPAARDGFN